MGFQIKQTRWLYISLSILSLCLTFTITPVKGLPSVTTPVLSSSQPSNGLEQGRNLSSTNRDALRKLLRLGKRLHNSIRLKAIASNLVVSMLSMTRFYEQLRQPQERKWRSPASEWRGFPCW
jgi:uncharacterized membrane protein